jgi:hypothetical protein
MKNEQQKAQVINNIEIHQTPESKSNAISFKIDFIDSIEAVEFL